MQTKPSSYLPWAWAGLWLGVNLLQSAWSPVDADEAYYWLYARQLAWGYYDHPPAVAALIALGNSLSPTTALGLRLGHVLAGTLAVGLLYDFVGPAPGLARPGSLTVDFRPAVPTSLWLYCYARWPTAALYRAFLRQYRSFLAHPNTRNGLWLAPIMAALLYSKYHGLLLILFSILPNLGFLLRQRAAWLAVGLGALLYMPHLYWQFAYDFPSFRYHLAGRNDPYELKFTTEFLLNQLLVFNPFFIYFYFVALRHTQSDRFLQACRWLVFLTLAFFLYSTSRGGAEPQWTATAAPPLLLLTFLWLDQASPRQYTLFRRLGLLSLLLFALARLYLVAPRSWLPMPNL
ncbi:MAG: glycosyltransferase family 39 protein [Lewinella sp.]|nr:glycosyltransferase family 39 protein [Lewinella sp.]